jgi:uncharacterized protein
LAQPDATATLVPRDRLAAALRGFGLPGIVALAAIVAANLVATVLSAALVLLWARWSRTPWRELGYVRPRSWAKSVTLGVLFGVALKFVLKAVVMPLLGGPAINPKYHYLAGNTAAMPSIVAAVIVSGGFAEETVYRGYLFERLGKLLGSGAAARTAIVVITTAFFAVVHHPDQGLAGVEQAAVTGLVFGTLFATMRQIWTVMIIHAAFDLAAVAIIYWNLESAVAHFFFK